MTDSFQVDPLPQNSRIEHEAASWIAQFDSGDVSAADRLALAEWMSRSPRHAAEIRRMAKLWGGIDEMLDAELLNETPSTLSGMVSAWVSARPAQFSLALLSTFAFIFFVSWGALLGMEGYNLEPQITLYKVEKGSNQSVTLDDGSVVHFNTDSIAEVEYTDSVRTVRLLRGEALFDVEKDAKRPFQVYAGKGLVVAIGTAFVVRVYEEDIDVTVTEGRVRLEAIQPQLLKSGNAGQALAQDIPATAVVSAGYAARLGEEIKEIVPLADNLIEKKIAWRKGQLVFEGDTLEFVVSEISRYSPETIIISDPELRDLRMGGIFEIGKVDALLGALELSLGIEVGRVRQDLIYLRKPLPASNTN